MRCTHVRFFGSSGVGPFGSWFVRIFGSDVVRKGSMSLGKLSLSNGGTNLRKFGFDTSGDAPDRSFKRDSGAGPFERSGGGGGPFGGSLGGLFDRALEWCSESHARDIARREGIDVRDIRFEKTPEGGVKVMVDAPNATIKQIEQLGEKVMDECPVARFRKTQVTSPQQKVEWIRIPDRYDR
ncbi:uncharacterized protein TEOVI_000588200 [Trypanosoma equiperdum]|uniref:Uncharacterized protein n=4 Tax=Trypanozoon TaxID=39700 RepID=Q4GYJ7_TRYB2|nr:hypothetical protein, conserved [Trypanosoma brucei brucei TREU927]XP_011771513.1 hypothetical protein, conserved [Trypanosoma brucei gambiense DAL972]RHW74475.1 Proteasome maturation protein 18 [Trypanosoma brucei equiperdum]SCU64446.1 hypothetical protein, conserved [Trypanosoma equiperdum]CAJ16587.1 hypothetical protein, conserved [Trypanosoma brucei brucei TREU927]CBH09072.1 hypothetical protein, conserved [Trypanosoma brucei gambiense DAL972]|eukprot:XP_011771513.1 hypothetical protein, conserved [Trypanosoma brucei gambiense DAL972]